MPISLIIQSDEKLKVYAKVLFFKITITPRKKKKPKLSYYSQKNVKKRRKKALKRQQKKARCEADASSLGEEKKRSVSDISDLISTITDTVTVFIDRFSNHLKIKLVNIDITIGTDDCAKTALLLGGVNEVLRYLMALLENHTDFSEKNISHIRTRADFVSEKSRAIIDLRFSITLFGVLASLIASIPGIKKILNNI